VVATSSHPSDDAVAGYCADARVACFRGDLDDTAGRLVAAAEWASFEAFARVSGDSPLLDPRIVDRAIRLHRDTPRADLVTNVMPRTFPVGESVEVIATDLLRTTSAVFERPSHREHVTQYFYEHADDFDIVNFSWSRDESHVRLAVDTVEDAERVEEVLSRLGERAAEASLEEILAALKPDNPP
jgi:spore coat polysaccharide biosynthesis protein SpsF